MSDQSKQPEAHPETFTAEQQQQPATPAPTDEERLVWSIVEVGGDVAAAQSAIAQVRGMYPDDFDLFLPVMAAMAPVLRPDWPRIAMWEFIDVLYVSVRYARFAVDTRTKFYRCRAAETSSSGRPN
jgi:hypothetical protein